MKMINFKSLAFAGAVILGLSSCDKDIESSSLTLDTFNKAKVTVYVYADLDLSAVGLEKAPIGTKVIFSTPYSSFNSGASGEWSDTISVDSNGMIEANLPVASNGVTYTITPVDFEASQTQVETDNAASINKYWTAGASSSTIKPGQFDVVEITYMPNGYKDFVEMVDIKLYLDGDFDATNEGNEVLPVDEITLQSQDETWNMVLNTSNTEIAGDGETYTVVSFSVEKNKEFDILPFVATKTIYDTDGIKKTTEDHQYYRFSLSYNVDKRVYVVSLIDGGKVTYKY